MQQFSMKLTVGVVVALCGAWTSTAANAGGYYFQPRSYYVATPIAPFPPLYRPLPIVVFEPVHVPSISVVSYYVDDPIFVPVLTPVYTPRIREHWHVAPLCTRYKYKVSYPGGVEYEYKYKRNLGGVRYSEKWDR